MSGLSGSAVPPGDGSDELALLSGYLDDELDDQERAFVRARLARVGDVARRARSRPFGARRGAGAPRARAARPLLADGHRRGARRRR